MLIPRFSLRWMLLATAVVAGLSLVLAQAARGTEWASGFLVAIGSVLLVFGLYGWTFGFAWVIAWAMRQIGLKFRPPVARSPFADAGPPRQIVTPIEPE
jgi:hypothetical protein